MQWITTIWNHINRINRKRVTEGLVGTAFTALFMIAMIWGIRDPESWRLGILANGQPTPDEVASIR